MKARRSGALGVLTDTVCPTASWRSFTGTPTPFSDVIVL